MLLRCSVFETNRHTHRNGFGSPKASLVCDILRDGRVKPSVRLPKEWFGRCDRKQSLQFIHQHFANTVSIQLDVFRCPVAAVCTTQQSNSLGRFGLLESRAIHAIGESFTKAPSNGNSHRVGNAIMNVQHGRCDARFSFSADSSPEGSNCIV